MCVVSNVFDYYQQPWQNPNTAPPQVVPVVLPQFMPPADRPWDREALDLLKGAIERLEKLDAKLGEPGCSDPRKDEFLKRIEERVAALEEAGRRGNGGEGK